MSLISVETTVTRDIKTVWDCWTLPEHIVKWNQASADWHCPKAVNDLRVGGTFVFTMASKDGLHSFDFTGTYTVIKEHNIIEYTIIDGRKVTITFTQDANNHTRVVESFETESVHSEDQQRQGWQAILESFRGYCETLAP